MSENCDIRDCPVNARVDGLEKEFDRYRNASSETHRQMFDRIGGLEQDRASNSTKLDSIEEKLDGVDKTVKALAEKPGKRWESLVGHFISAAVGAFLLWVVSGMPGLK